MQLSRGVGHACGTQEEMSTWETSNCKGIAMLLHCQAMPQNHAKVPSCATQSVRACLTSCVPACLPSCAWRQVGIVGRTGSGKTTLLMALFRMINLAGGRIIMDGQDISALPLREVWRTLASQTAQWFRAVLLTPTVQ